VTSSFAGLAGNPAGARRAVRAALDGVHPEVVSVAELLVSELVTNALVHAGAEPFLTVTVDVETVRVEVADPDPNAALTARHAGQTSAHGRGLAIVQALARSWGVERRAPGKVVWFELGVAQQP
jgi:anti-sigma regulatory factor (Ser/Thr protein kinase)